MIKSPLETDIFNYKTPEFYINMKNIPDKGSSERGAFVSEEKRKCREGININGIYIPGGLYFHLNYYKLEGDSRTTPGKKEIMLPILRDNEWVIFNDYYECQKEGKIYPLFGARQLGKTEIESSLCLRELCLYPNTEAMGLFANTGYKDTFTKKMYTAIEHGESFIIIPTIDKDWSKDLIRFGFTRPDNTLDLRGRLYIYNTQEGNKVQVGSGKSLTFLLFDEAAASPFVKVLNTMKPALLTDYGRYRCSPMITFTGGETDKAEDAKNLINTVDKEKQFYMTLDSGKEVGGRFMDGRYRKDCKEPMTISDYTQIKTGTWIDDHQILVSNKEKAKEKIEAERAQAAKSSNKDDLLFSKIFFPLTIEDVFLSESNNKFPIPEIESHLISLENYEPSYVDLYRNDKNEVTWRFSDLKPIDKFPVAPKDFKDAPFIIYEHPQYGVPHGTYCIGVDPYNEDTSSDKVNSLGAVYVYKRMYNPMGEFQNSIVASWRGRKKEIKQFHELVLMIAEYYKAIEGVLPENEDKTLIQYFFFKKKGHYLADSFELAKQINPTTRTNRLKGLSASTVNQRHYMNLMYAETKDDICVVDETGNETIKMGVYNIPDKMLLVEMKNYRGKTSGKGVHDGNFDSIIAYGHCLTLARYYDVKYPTAGRWKPENDEDEVKKPPKVKLPWGTYEQAQNNLFIKPKRSYRPINRMFI